MAGAGEIVKNSSGSSSLSQSVQGQHQGAAGGAASAPTTPNPPTPPPDLKHAIAAGVKGANEGAQAINSVAQKANSIASKVANPGAALAGALGGAADEKMSNLVAGLAAALPAFPAATMLKMALGIPHAHVKHPPSGPPPLPPIPFPPMGPIMLGNSVTVLINNMPSARCGDYGLNPTCCGVVPPLSALYEIVTGSSNVYIGGSRAARANIDITMHCFHIPSPKIPIKAAKLAAIAGKVGKVAGKVSKVAGAVGKVAGVAGAISQATAVASSFAEAEANDDAAMAAAIGLSVAMMAAQAAADAAASAMTSQIGTDQPMIPPVGTPGMILVGSPNVMIGGFPLPSFSAMAQGLLKRLKGIQFTSGNGQQQNKPCSREGQPIDLITGACTENFADGRLPAPLPLLWQRWYDSRWSDREGPVGRGFRHEYQRELRRTLEGMEYINPEGESVRFQAPRRPGETDVCGGFQLGLLDNGVHVLRKMSGPAMHFRFQAGHDKALLMRLEQGRGWLEFSYAGDRLSEIRTSDGQKVHVESDRAGRITHLRRVTADRRQERPLVTYQYDEHGNLVRFDDALGQAATYAYDANHRMICRTDRRGYRFFNEYDEQGRCVRERGEDGLADCKVEYFPESRCSIATYADGSTTTVFYDENQVLREVIEPSGGRKRFDVGPDGQVTQMVDPLGNIVKHLYDAWGGHSGRLTPQGHLLPPLNEAANPPDPRAYQLPRTPLEWEHGRLLAASRIGLPKSTDPILYNCPPQVFNAILHPLSAEEQPHPRSRSPRQVLDALGRIVEEWDHYGEARRWKRDGEGNVLEDHDRDGQIIRSEYKSWNMLARRTAPTGAVCDFDYSIRSTLTKLVDGNRNVFEFGYDAWDRLTEIRRHGRLMERYVYDQADNLIEKKDGDGRTLLKLEILPGNLFGVRKLGSGETQCFEYDEAGRFTLAANDKLQVTLSYAPSGRPLTDQRDGIGIEHTYQDGRLAATTYLGRFTIQYAYSQRDTVLVQDPTGASHRFRVSEGGLIAREFSNGTTELAHYSAEGRCLNKVGTSRVEPGVVRWHHAFAYSAEGDLLQSEGPRGERTRYSYEGHRLRWETAPNGIRREFRYDLADNLVAQPHLSNVTHQEGNRLQSANDEKFSYNARHCISERASGGRRIRYEYDALDRLIACDINGERWTAVYDPFARRVSKTWRGQTTRYHWDGFRLMGEEKPDGTLRLYLYADETALVPFMFVEYATAEAEPASGVCYFLFTNQIGAPVRVEDSRQQVVWHAHIEPFGWAEIKEGSRIDMPLRFPGHYFDVETGLHYNRFRYYDPILGRYLQSDPLGMVAGFNVYAYPRNPLNVVDIDGLNHSPTQGPGNPGQTPAQPNQQATPPAPAGGTPARKPLPTVADADKIKGTHPDKVEDFKDIRGKSAEEILSRVPKDAVGRDLTPVPGGAQTGVEYKWVRQDANGQDVTHRVRIHDADPSAETKSPGCNAGAGDVARVQQGKKCADNDGNYHPPGIANPASPHYDEKKCNDTHIPIEGNPNA